MSKPTLSDFNFDSSALRRYEVEVNGVRVKADTLEDHQRALEAIAALKGVTSAAQNIQPAAVPFEQVPVHSPNGLTVTELLNRYLQMKQLATGSVSAVQNTALQFATFVGKRKTIDQILKVDVTRFAEKLKIEGLALQTVQTKINLLKAMFNFAREYSYLKGENPVSLKVITKAQKMAAGYDIFDDADIVAVYAKSYFGPQKIKDPDYYYACLIAVVTGLRIGAITSLCKNDIQKTESETWFLRIRDDKTANGKRDVPVIPELLNSGFQAYGSLSQPHV
ncbi:hypothetical protein AVMA1855_25280 [Acidovorax sp. SUPP1855]|uniref:hypothetical protein n=1 Tax=Acidovorax sp. SUPP1855 TaxID=431774 RepID=UPI0023DE28BC|nr:hypothetical protein [Acidovorax sp. SUPP1855]GKS87530.1 hypothetical protein AVMA1855_25280 [Acidovorax sp. SUPP1855]